MLARAECAERADERGAALPGWRASFCVPGPDRVLGEDVGWIFRLAGPFSLARPSRAAALGMRDDDWRDLGVGLAVGFVVSLAAVFTVGFADTFAGDLSSFLARVWG